MKNKKLKLNKEVVAILNLKAIKGGATTVVNTGKEKLSVIQQDCGGDTAN